MGITLELVVVLLLRARGAEPRAFGDRNEDGSEAKEMEPSVALVAEKKVRRTVAGPTFLAENVVVIGIGTTAAAAAIFVAENSRLRSLRSSLPQRHSPRSSWGSH